MFSNFKNNFLYFYYPSLGEKDKEDFENMINEEINKNGKEFKSLANSYEMVCNNLRLSYILRDNFEIENYNFNFGKFLNEYLIVLFKYLKELISHTKDLLEKFKKSDNNNYTIWPLHFFINYFNKIAKKI